MSDSFVTPWTVAHQASLSLAFHFPQENWSELPFPSPGIRVISPQNSLDYCCAPAADTRLDPEILRHFSIKVLVTSGCRGTSFHLPTNSMSVCVCVYSQSCQTLCNLRDYSPPGSSVHGIFQAIILEWAAISFPRGSSQPRDRTNVSCIDRQILYRLPHLGLPPKGILAP